MSTRDEANVVAGLRDGATRGGHLLEARVRPTLEMFAESSAHLKRKTDEDTGPPLLDVEGG